MRAQEIEVSKFLTPPIVPHDRSGRGWNALAGIHMPGISSFRLGQDAPSMGHVRRSIVSQK